MTIERLQERISDFAKAFLQLEKAAAMPHDEFIRDSLIQRFEFTYELAWKMLKLRLELDFIDAKTPRQVFQDALQAGFISDGNAWSELHKQRNLTSHTYDEVMAEQVYAYVVECGLMLFRELAQVSAGWRSV